MNSLTHNLIDQVQQLLKKCAGKPVVVAGSVVEDYPSFVSSDRHMMQDITQHVIDVHNCRGLYFLGGPEDNAVTIDRLSCFADALVARGIP